MKTPLTVLLACVSLPLLAQQATSHKSFPKPDFLLHIELKDEKPHTVLGPMKTDNRGRTTGSFAVYGGSSLVQVSSLSFSGDGRTLAVGSTPDIVDIWDVETRKNISSFEAGSTIAISPDGRLLATDGKDGIRLWDVSSRKVLTRIPRSGGTIWRFSFDSSGKWLVVGANGENDAVFDVVAGRQIASLTNTQEAQFSADGLLVVGGNSKHIISWSTKDWSQTRDLPNGPDYVTRFAVDPSNNFAVVGGPNSARLVRLDTGDEVARLGTGYTNFAAFDQTGSLIFTYTGSGFGVWDTTGKLLCSAKDLGNGTMALSHDNRWLAAAPAGHSRDVTLWKVENIVGSCSKS
jgi:WD40 repeat protein